MNFIKKKSLFIYLGFSYSYLFVVEIDKKNGINNWWGGGG